jgi:hypothetical protein
MKFTQLMLGLFGGSFMSAALTAIQQDMYGDKFGSKEGYIQHIESLQSWQWLSGSAAAAFDAALLTIAIGICLYAGSRKDYVGLIVRKEKKEAEK